MAGLIPDLEELYLCYKKDVYRYLRTLTHDPTEAEDLLSDTFLRAIRYLPTFRGEASAKTWLFSIARNVWLESLRKRRPTVSYDDLLGLYIEDTLAADVGARLTLARVRQLLDERGPRDRTIVELRAQGYAYAEIAARLHITENTARVAEHRARAWLKAKLKEEGLNE